MATAATLGTPRLLSISLGRKPGSTKAAIDLASSSSYNLRSRFQSLANVDLDFNSHTLKIVFGIEDAPPHQNLYKQSLNDG
jgi:hypothetical protein